MVGPVCGGRWREPDAYLGTRLRKRDYRNRQVRGVSSSRLSIFTEAAGSSLPGEAWPEEVWVKKVGIEIAQKTVASNRDGRKRFRESSWKHAAWCWAPLKFN